MASFAASLLIAEYKGMVHMKLRRLAAMVDHAQTELDRVRAEYDELTILAAQLREEIQLNYPEAWQAYQAEPVGQQHD